MAKESGLIVNRLEDDQELQDAVLSLHHIYMFTFSNTRIVELIVSNNGNSFSIVRPDEGISKEGITKLFAKSIIGLLRTAIDSIIIIGFVIVTYGILGFYLEGFFGIPMSIIAIGVTTIIISLLLKIRYR